MLTQEIPLSKTLTKLTNTNPNTNPNTNTSYTTISTTVANTISNKVTTTNISAHKGGRGSIKRSGLSQQMDHSNSIGSVESLPTNTSNNINNNNNNTTIYQRRINGQIAQPMIDITNTIENHQNQNRRMNNDMNKFESESRRSLKRISHNNNNSNNNNSNNNNSNNNNSNNNNSDYSGNNGNNGNNGSSKPSILSKIKSFYKQHQNENNGNKIINNKNGNNINNINNNDINPGWTTTHINDKTNSACINKQYQHNLQKHENQNNFKTNLNYNNHIGNINDINNYHNNNSINNNNNSNNNHNGNVLSINSVNMGNGNGNGNGINGTLSAVSVMSTMSGISAMSTASGLTAITPMSDFNGKTPLSDSMSVITPMSDINWHQQQINQTNNNNNTNTTTNNNTNTINNNDIVNVNVNLDTINDDTSTDVNITNNINNNNENENCTVKSINTINTIDNEINKISNNINNNNNDIEMSNEKINSNNGNKIKYNLSEITQDIEMDEKNDNVTNNGKRLSLNLNSHVNNNNNNNSIDYIINRLGENDTNEQFGVCILNEEVRFSSINWYNENACHLSKRKEIVDWVCRTGIDLGLQRSTIYRAIQYFDRICSEREVNSLHFHFVSGVCLLVATKWVEKEEKVPSLRRLRRLLASATKSSINENGMIYSRDQVRSLEMKILTLINWSLKTILPIDFVEYFVSNKWENLLIESPPPLTPLVPLAQQQQQRQPSAIRNYNNNNINNINNNNNKMDIDYTLQSSVIFSSDILDGHNELDKHPQAKIYIRKFGVFFLDIIAQEYEFLKYSCSMVGAVVILASRMALKIEPYWTNKLIPIIGYEYKQLQTCFLHLWKLYKLRFPDDCKRAEQVQPILIVNQ